MRTKINNVHVDGYSVFNVARQKGKLNCTWEEFYEKYNKYKSYFKKAYLCFLDDDYIFIEENDSRFLNKNKSKGYSEDRWLFRVRLQFRDYKFSKYFCCEEDAIEHYKEVRQSCVYKIADELSEIYDKEIIDKFLNKYL